jgi:hypothetical protein
MDLGLLAALAVGVLSFLAYMKLRRRPVAPPQCADCQVEMEYSPMRADPQLVDAYGGAGVGAWVNGQRAVRMFQCPRCNRRRRMR